MPKHLLILGLCVVAIGGGCAKSDAVVTPVDTSGAMEASNWVSYTAPDGSFSAEYPATPTYSSDVVPLDEENISFTYETYGVETSDSFYSVNIFHYPETLDMSDVDARLQGAVDGMLANMNGTLTSSEYGYFGDYRGISYVMESTDGLQLKGYTFVVDYDVYQLMYISVTEEYNDVNYQRFANSFTLGE